MPEDFLLFDAKAPIATLTLNRPRQRNALSAELMRAVISRLRSVAKNHEVRVVILAANGPAFCAGHDLSEMVGRAMGQYREIFDVCTEMMTAIKEIPQPVIAKVDGMATAAGCQLVAACDLVVASERATFATPGVKIGLFCSTPMVEVTRSVGRKRALEMLLTGKPVGAHTAADWGLVNRVVPRERLDEAVCELAMDIAKASPLTVAIGKQAFYSQIDLDMAKAYAYAKEVMSMNALAADAQEGMSAFLEKRPATWQGR